MAYIVESMAKLISELCKLPGIGEKSAQRLAFYILKTPTPIIKELSDSIIRVKEKVKFCSICFNITEVDPCNICTDEQRDKSILCVVEEPIDIMAIEKTKEYKGKYHVLLGVLSPIDGVGPDDIKIKELIDRINKENIQEIILATNLTIEGETTAMYISKILKPLNIKVTRLAHGLPMGTSIEYTDEITLRKAFVGRVEL